jgi:hypothetical protein
MADTTKTVTIPQIGKLHGPSNYHPWRSMAVMFLDIISV